jgi:hypothetical protein
MRLSNSSVSSTNPSLTPFSDSSRRGTGWSGAWRDALGAGWAWQLAFIAACVFTAGAMRPLADPDLPIHLATGEWIVRHHALPFVEPWAWTRPGEPFYAYSWLIECAYYLLLVHVGVWGLHVLQGLVLFTMCVAVMYLGYVARWRAWTTVVVAGVQIIVVSGAAPYLRPQALLAIAIPLVWAVVLRARDAVRLTWELPVLAVISALTANTHLLFPILAGPLALLFVAPPRVRTRYVAIPAAIVMGWLVSPYALAWIGVFKLNFAPNAVLNPPSPIAEYKPGFTLARSGGLGALALPLVFLALPWLAARNFAPRERLVHGALWLGGALIFALAARGLLVWWLVIIPAVAAVVDAMPAPTIASVRTAQRAAVLALAALFVVDSADDLGDPWLRAGIVSWRTLPSTNAKSMEPIAAWLDCNLKSGAHGRLVTTFNLGGYVPWRLPRLSESVDGRTFFPDSVAKAETYFPPNKAKIPLQPWRTADLAIVPLNFPVAAVLDTARGWRRVAITSQLNGPAVMIGLWVTESWWSAAGKSPLASGLIPLPHLIRPTAESCGRS